MYLVILVRALALQKTQAPDENGNEGPGWYIANPDVMGRLLVEIMDGRRTL